MAKKMTLRAALMEANGLLRTAHAVAKRDGKETNWPAFRDRLTEHLHRVHRICYPLPKEK
jgi:hypothetical protein